VEVTKEQFREAYVFGERELDSKPLIHIDHNFHNLLLIKVGVETSYLVRQEYWKVTENRRIRAVRDIADYCYSFVLRTLKVNREVLSAIYGHYPMALVSNFYGNMRTILRDFKIEYFSHIIESAIVGIRKPNPAIYEMGIKALDLQPEEVLVVGDSYAKDIVPSHGLGCHTVWLQGTGWAPETVDENLPDAIIHKLPELLPLLSL
jgi:putative hydrolase of the HAD superfamily